MRDVTRDVDVRVAEEMFCGKLLHNVNLASADAREVEECVGVFGLVVFLGVFGEE